MTGINFIVTTHTMRAKGMTLVPHAALRLGDLRDQRSSCSWRRRCSGSRVALVGIDHVYHFGIFDPALGGDPVLFQHLFWFYSHPAVYIMILPGDGRDQRDRLHLLAQGSPSSYAAIAISSLGIAFVGFLTWGHHMFVAGMSEFDAGIFGVLSMFVAHLLGDQGRSPGSRRCIAGAIHFNTPMLYFFWFLFLFVFGGMTGVAVATQSLDVHWHDTYFVVAHFHFIMVGGTLTALPRRRALLVPQDVRPPLLRAGGPAHVDGRVPRLRPDVHSAVPPRQRGDAAALLQLSGALPVAQRPLDRRRVPPRGRALSRW